MPRDLHAQESLLDALRHEWPAYLAFATSFVTILIVWVNHHNLFRLIHRSDHTLLLLNGLLLFTVTVIHFPTNVIAEYIREPDARTAAVFYAGTFLAMAVAFNWLWAYAQQGGCLLAQGADPDLVRMISLQFRIGPLSYLAAVAVSAISAPAGFGLVIVLAIYWALPERLRPALGRGT